VVLSINEKRRRAGDSGNAKAATDWTKRDEILSQASVVVSAAWALEASGRIAGKALRSRVARWWCESVVALIAAALVG
jgi:hypothetical protein